MTKKNIITFSIILVMLISIVVIAESRGHTFSRLIDTILDNQNHYLSCDQLPTVDEVNTSIQNHRDVAEKIIKEVGRRHRDGEIKVTWEVTGNSGMALEGDRDGSYFGIYWGESYPNCQNTGRGDILFDYFSHSDREIIEKTLGGSFFGIPYRGENH